MNGLRVGVDVVDVREVQASIDRFGPAYLDRVFTVHEQGCAQGDEVVRARALAARFAAKEAVVKVLRPAPNEPLPWTSIEVRRDASGWCEIALTTFAARVAARSGLTDLAVSFSHQGEQATAVVVGTATGTGTAEHGRDDS